MVETSPTSRSFVDRWLVLIAACLGAFVVPSNTTAVMTAAVGTLFAWLVRYLPKPRP